MALSGEVIVGEKIARCKSPAECRDLVWTKAHVKTAFSGMRNPSCRLLCFCLETFRHFDRFRTRPIARDASAVERPGKSRVKIFDPLCDAAAGVQACNACRETYISFETFPARRFRPGNAGIAGTLDAPRFRSRWPALCVSVGTAVDELTTGRFRQKDRRNPAPESPAERRAGAHRGTRSSRPINRASLRRVTNEPRYRQGNKKSAWPHMGNKNERPQHITVRKPD
ncbi:hypothetical protein [Burkholderia cepacia]|uniref:hypothetical protein n=1 Tax=Burkholderia cepacia TaxID=292 RepID=UPI000A622728|nr:hypothetical protein [Burkholderia cepacia]